MARLRDEAGFEQKAAEAMVVVLSDVMADMATKTFVRQELAALEQRLEGRFADIDRRFTEQSADFEQRFTEQRADFEQRFSDIERRFAEQSAEMDRRFHEFGARMEHAFLVQTRWMVSVMIAVAGLSLAIVKLL